MSVGEAGPESAAGGPRSLSGPGWRRFPVQRGWRAGGPERWRRRPTDNEGCGAALSGGGGGSDAGPGAGRAPAMDNQVRSRRPGPASHGAAAGPARTRPRALSMCTCTARFSPPPFTATPG